MTLCIRAFEPRDEHAVVALWNEAELTRPWNDPRSDIATKLCTQPELFLVGEVDGRIVATAMAGYDGHRGWVYYLGVLKAERRKGHARALMLHVERALGALGCPKLNLQVRAENSAAVGFYEALGYERQDLVALGKRLDVPAAAPESGPAPRS